MAVLTLGSGVSVTLPFEVDSGHCATSASVAGSSRSDYRVWSFLSTVNLQHHNAFLFVFVSNVGWTFLLAWEF